jgi:hypothetical protein
MDATQCFRCGLVVHSIREMVRRSEERIARSYELLAEKVPTVWYALAMKDGIIDFRTVLIRFVFALQPE